MLAPRSASAGYPANNRLNIAVVGVGGRGRVNLDGVAGENIVALCDVDDHRASDAYAAFPKVKKFKDYRVMLDKMDREIDAVVISTPDHTHYHPATRVMGMSKHLYLEKPMAHSVWEVRELTNLARESGVATQLGVQRHTIPNVHRVVELIQSGAIGTVTEVHSWVDSERGMVVIPENEPNVPTFLDWDLWVGPAKKRAYHPSIAPYGWRFWWDYGTGETGNWGCHILDLPYWALSLTYPEHVSATGPEPDDLTTTKSMHAQFRFAKRGNNAPVTLHWYQQAGGPEILKRHGLPAGGNNNLFIGTEGMLLCGFNQFTLLPEEKYADFTAPDPFIPDSPGFHQEWIDACKGGPRPTCEFDYSGPMTETVLLGNAAYRAQAEFDWDSKELRTEGSNRAQKYIQPRFRNRWRG
ncbi:MAG: NADH-dependent dehydrogenase [Candidatus Hydrogenedentota bacterium]|nr:MAG: NADH-dependent dehydrogenase [Candidatus Hydrogenedentota bacterium]